MRRLAGFLNLWVPVAAYMGLIYFMSSRGNVRLIQQVPDVLLHGGEFFLLAILVVRALNGGLLVPVVPRCYLWAFVLSAHYALLDELHQALVPGRVPSLLDLLADVMGIDLALAAIFLLQRSLGPRRLDAAGSAAR